nr:MAG TPA: hypothetical protein [Caudoviricetes sp.]
MVLIPKFFLLSDLNFSFRHVYYILENTCNNRR